jgi:hypothetical protein
MRYYKVNQVEHKVFDPDDATPVELEINDDWRKGQVGDWVKTDDDCVIQILRRGRMLKPKGKTRVREYVGTCTGTFVVSDKVKMDSSRRVNIYSFGGDKSSEDVLLDRDSLTKGEIMFVMYVTGGMAPRDAYMKAFPTKNLSYAEQRSSQLIKTKRVQTAMKEELKPVFEELGIDEKAVLQEINSIALGSEKDETRLKALFKLSDIMDLEDKTRTSVQQITGVQFKGFTDKDVEALPDRPKEIEK